MITFYSPDHQAHAPAYEYFRGDYVPCFESAARTHFIHAELKARGHEIREPTSDATESLNRIHDARYLSFLKTAWKQWLAVGPDNQNLQPFPSVWPVRTLRSDVEPKNFTARLGLYSMDNGTPLSAGTWTAAKSGADAAASAAALIAAGGRSAFCATRPPGHHAGSDFMGGYCFLNNAAIAAETLLIRGFNRVAILDVDYHHGNGTQSIFYRRADVLVVNIHGDPSTEYPFYLGYADEKGAGLGAGYNLNLPLPVGTQIDAWFAALDVALNRIAAHQADALVVSLGLDTFVGDPISKFSLQSSDFSLLGERLGGVGLPTIFILEGGYAAHELGINAVNVLDGFEQV